ncbi:MAG: hypothetical protein AABX54_00705 [Nanoarchaeota archaeon]
MILTNKLRKTGFALAGLAGLVGGMNYSGEGYAQQQNKPGVRVSDGADYVIRADYRDREHEWSLYKEQVKNPRKPSATGRTDNGNTQISNLNEDRVYGIGGQTENDSEPRLSRNFILEDFAKAYGISKWKMCLTESERQKTAELFNRLDLNGRKTLCNVYANTPGFYEASFSAEGKKSFEKLNQAYQNLVTAKKANASQELFNSELEGAVRKLYPWIRFDNGRPLNVPDRMLVLWVADSLEKKSGKRLINWDNVAKYSSMPVQERF